MAGKRKINSEVDSETKKLKNEEWDIYQTEAFLHFDILLSKSQQITSVKVAKPLVVDH